ncbi:MAG: hypothetical protein ACI89G_000222 [Minisyncoccia bacterium]|jgi:hypothetical protein|tara:strand:- start:111 stop:266 length:156 start_codon:yes stop_codon:yes gene_type:complete
MVGFDVTDSAALRLDVDRHRDDFHGEPVLTQEIEGRLGSFLKVACDELVTR